MKKDELDINYIDISLHGNSIVDNILTNPLELFIQEIEMSINIMPNEVWGMNAWLDLRRYIFNKYVTVTQIRNEITTFINKNCFHASYFNWKVSVDPIKNPNGGSDLIYINFTVSAPNQSGDIEEYLQKFLIG